MKTKYIKLKLGFPRVGEEIFVREQDFKAMKNSFKSKNPNKIVGAAINLLISSPDGMKELTTAFDTFRFITKRRSIEVLESLRDMVNYHIKKLKDIEKAKKKKSKIRVSKSYKRRTKKVKISFSVGKRGSKKKKKVSFLKR